MKRVLFLTPLTLAALAACAPKAEQIQAGQWELVQEIQSMSAPSASAEVREQLRNRAGRPDSGRLCLTEDQARRFLEFTKQVVTSGQASGCRFSDEAYAGGVMRQTATCPIGGPPGAPPTPGAPRGDLTATIDGRFTATTFNATVRTRGPNLIAPGGGEMSVNAILRGRRIGDCPATPTPPAGPPGQPTSL